MNQSQTVTVNYAAHVHFRRRRREINRVVSQPSLSAGRIPRLARLMALAIRLEQLLHEGVVSSQAELARLGHVTRARLTQIMSLRQLAPDIQEEILFLAPTEHGREAITERQVRPLLRTLVWDEQRRAWAELKRDAA
jgi:hypothetical protein